MDCGHNLIISPQNNIEFETEFSIENVIIDGSLDENRYSRRKPRPEPFFNEIDPNPSIFFDGNP